LRRLDVCPQSLEFLLEGLESIVVLPVRRGQRGDFGHLMSDLARLDLHRSQQGRRRVRGLGHTVQPLAQLVDPV
jgi:hypothetical protein